MRIHLSSFNIDVDVNTKSRGGARKHKVITVKFALNEIVKRGVVCIIL